jgi:UPF0755 protein
MHHQRSQTSSFKKKLRVVVVLLLLIFIILGLWWIHGSSPINTADTTQKDFIVKPGEPLREIANRLQQNGLIADPIVFFFIVKQNNLDGKIQAGEFHLSPNMPPKDVAEAMTKGTLNVWVTIPEGKRATEIADIFKQKFPQYNEEWQTKLIEQEGYLFPDTYLFPKDTTLAQIISTMKDNFNKKFESAPTNPDNQYTQNQIVTVASLVEREAKYPEDRPLVASVIYNRLKAGMPLQLDATIQYILGYQQSQQTWWKNNLSADDLQLNSPYNTYKNVGLPPTPICNPGLAALAAAVKPEQTNYFFYVSDKQGHNHYAETLAQHNANIKKYGVQ